MQGRPSIIDSDTLIALNGATARTMLQPNSEPRAIVLKLVDLGGRATLQELEGHFLYDLSARLRALHKAGWIEVHRPGKLKLPRRPKVAS